VYTDGSKNAENKVGSGFCIPELQIEKGFRLTDNQSVYTAELCAIYEALKYLLNYFSDVNTNMPNREITVYSDSLSSVTAISNHKRNSESELTNNIIKLTETINQRITVAWIPGHINIAGNDTADKLAKTATQHDTIDIQIKSENTVLTAIDDYAINKWQTIWDNSTTGTFYKQVQPLVSTQIKYKNKSRQVETTITRLRFGKCSLNKYLKDIKCHDTGLCLACKVPETIEHYLLQCTESKVKEKILEYCKRHNIPTDLNNILINTTILERCFSLINKKI
jgi:ribonuclease HI